MNYFNLFLTTKYYKKKLNSDSFNRLKSYINSLTWGKKSLSFIQKVASLSDTTIDKDEINLLFGPIFAEKILSFYNNIPTNYDCLFEFEDKKQTLYFYNAYKKLNSVDENSKIKIEDDDLFFDVFSKFFIKLGELIGEDDKNKYQFDFTDYKPNREQVLENSYLRLRVGPTFNELLELMKIYFTSKNINISDISLHTLLSRTLDRQIDQGFIVPVFDCYGRRIFRKGEPNPYNIYELSLLNFLDIDPSFSELKNTRNLLTSKEYDDVLSALKNYEKTRYYNV